MDDCSAKTATTAIAGMPPNWYHKRLLSVNTFLQAFIDSNCDDKQVKLNCRNVDKNGNPEREYTVLQVLRGLESSLRTKSDSWVNSFLLFKEEQRGLNLLVRFLTFRLQLQLGHMNETLHLSLLILKDIMERPFGFKQVVRMKKEMEPGEEGQVTSSTLSSSSPALNAIALSIAHPNVIQPTKSLALDLLAATCLVDGGTYHQLVLAAFDHVQREMPAEERRFQSLVHLFTTFAAFDRRLSVSCMQFINIVVNAPFTPPNLNLRVYLQVEFRMLSLDEAYLRERLSGSGRGCCLADLQGHIQAYLDNIIDVGALLVSKTAFGDAICDGGSGEHQVKPQIRNKYRVVKSTWRTQMENVAEKRKMAKLQAQMEERKYQEKLNSPQCLRERK